MTEKEINKIVSENLNYVKSVANQYKGKGVEFDDLVSEGTLAMLMAARKFQADRGTDLWRMPVLSFTRLYHKPLINKREFTVYQKIRRNLRLETQTKLYLLMHHSAQIIPIPYWIY